MCRLISRRGRSADSARVCKSRRDDGRGRSGAHRQDHPRAGSDLTNVAEGGRQERPGQFRFGAGIVGGVDGDQTTSQIHACDRTGHRPRGRSPACERPGSYPRQRHGQPVSSRGCSVSHSLGCPSDRAPRTRALLPLREHKYTNRGGQHLAQPQGADQDNRRRGTERAPNRCEHLRAAQWSRKERPPHVGRS